MPAQAIPISYRNVETVPLYECSVRQLIDVARVMYDVTSLYSLGNMLGVDPTNVQRWYKSDTMPRTTRALLIRLLITLDVAR